MKRLQALFLLVGGLSVGLLVGRQWGLAARTSQAEAVVASEFALLQRAAGMPSCDEVRGARDQVQESRASGLRVLWRKADGKPRVQRLVVSAELDFAYEEIDSPCAP